MPFNRSEFQALQAFLLACRPRITLFEFENILNDACEHGLSIDGVVYRNPDKLLKALASLNARNPVTFCAYFKEIYEQLSLLLRTTDEYSNYRTSRISTPADPMKVAKAALTFRLSKRATPLSWDAFMALVAESLDLGVNRQPRGLGSRFGKRMNSLLSIYMASGSSFDETLGWLIQETTQRSENPEKYPRKFARKQQEKSLQEYQRRLISLAVSEFWDSRDLESVTSEQLVFEDAVLEAYKARIGPLMRSWRVDAPSRARYGLLMYQLFLEGNLRAADPLVHELGRKPRVAKPSRFTHSRAGDAWDTADHWGWYY